MRQFTLILALGLAAFAAAQTPPVQVKTPDVQIPPRVDVPTIGSALAPLTADEAVKLALRLQPAIEVARGNLQQAAGRTRQTASNLLPAIGLGGSLSRTDVLRGGRTSGSTGNGGSIGLGSVTGGGLFTSGNFAVTATQLLFDFGRTRDLVRQQRAIEAAAGEDVTIANLDVALDVRQRLADLAQATRLVKVAEGNVTTREAQLRLAQANLDEGLGPPADVVNAKTNLAAAASSLVAARATESSARIALALAIGVDPRTPITAADQTLPSGPPADPTSLFSDALAHRPETRQARLNVEATGFALSAARKTNSPAISASASVGTNGNSDPFQRQSTTIGINLDWPFFDSGFTAGAIQEAKGAQRVALAQLKQAQQTVVSDVGQAYLDLATALQQVTLAEVGVANAAEGVRLAEGRYRGGFGSFLEITNAQAQLFSAQQTLETNRGNVLRAQAALDRAVGRGL